MTAPLRFIEKMDIKKYTTKFLSKVYVLIQTLIAYISAFKIDG
jgi:hypothetical protein